MWVRMVACLCLSLCGPVMNCRLVQGVTLPSPYDSLDRLHGWNGWKEGYVWLWGVKRQPRREKVHSNSFLHFFFNTYIYFLSVLYYRNILPHNLPFVPNRGKYTYDWFLLWSVHAGFPSSQHVPDPLINCFNRIGRSDLVLRVSIEFSHSQVLQLEVRTWRTHSSQVNCFSLTFCISGAICK